jgi:hypothetical protein
MKKKVKRYSEGTLVESGMERVVDKETGKVRMMPRLLPEDVRDLTFEPKNERKTIGPKDVDAKPKEYQEPPKGSITKSSLRGSGGAGGSGGIPSDKMDKMKKMNYKAGGKVAGKLATRGYGCAKK